MTISFYSMCCLLSDENYCKIKCCNLFLINENCIAVNIMLCGILCTIGCATCDDERVYLTATGMVSGFEAWRTVADMIADARSPGRVLGKQAMVITEIHLT